MKTFYVKEFTHENDAIEDFLNLPSSLYPKHNYVQNRTEEEQLLKEKHILSKYFKLVGFIVYDKSNHTAARALLIIYPNDNNIYFGYFESINNKQAARTLLDYLCNWAKNNTKCKNIIGPVNASFWIGYRLKIDNFNEPYFGEPYNLSYYKKLLEDSGFVISEKYLSNIFSKKIDFKTAKKFHKNYSSSIVKSNACVVRSPKREEYDKTLGIVHEMLSELYNDFPIYKSVTKKDFVEYFSKLEPILDFSMIKIAYLGETPIGFLIAFPDYGNILYSKDSLFKNIHILIKKFFSSRYVLMYMGVRKSQQHNGISKAMIKPVALNIFLRHASCIGALIHEGKITADYEKENIENQNHYALFKKELR